VPEGAVFVLGDNRGASRDARYWQTPWVPEDDIVGEAFIRLWPLPAFRRRPRPTVAALLLLGRTRP